MTEILTPDAVVTAILYSKDEISRGVRIVSDAWNAFQEADRVYDLAFADAFIEHDGNAYEKKYAAERATTSLRKERNSAEGAYRYADRRTKALEADLSANQTVMRRVEAMFGAAGVGER